MKPEPAKKPATIYDVARLAGVSHITVSRVVNGKNNVTADTRERVTKAMRALGYVPNPAAQTLQTRKSRTIELITTDPWGSPAEAVARMSTIAGEHQYQLAMLVTTPAAMTSVLSTAPSRMVAGVILYAQQVDMDYDEVYALTRTYPFVHMGGKPNNPFASVTYDHYRGAQLVVQHLMERGHRQIAFIGGQPQLLDGQLRREAWHDTLTRAGLSPGPVAVGDFGAPSGATAMATLLDGGEPFTAVFAASDAMAIGAMYVLHTRGLRVPDDMAVAGYDDSMYSAYAVPPLTTIENDFSLGGRLAMEYLLELIADPTTPQYQRVLPARLVVRASTGG